MAFDEQLAARVRDILTAQPELHEKKMFGGICFLLCGNMCCGVIDDRIILRINGPMYDELLARTETSMMDFTGKPMRGFLYVASVATNTKAGLQKWLSYSIDYCLALPAK